MPSRRPATSCSTSVPSGWICASSWRRRSWPGSVAPCRRSTKCTAFAISTPAICSGFVDGTENPTGRAVIDATLIGDEDAPFAGGSYVIVQKYLHDLAGWNALSTETQERIIGRTKLSDIELDDAIKPTSAHSALTVIEEDGQRDQDPARQHAVRPGVGRASSAPISSATAGRRAPSSRCSRTCSSAARRATTTGCSTSAGPSPATSSSCRPRHSSSDAGDGDGPQPAAASPQPSPTARDGSLGIGSLKGDRQT